MNAVNTLNTLTGQFTGTKKLWMAPGSPAQESVSQAVITTVGGGFSKIEYTWSTEGRPQNGVLLVRTVPGHGDQDMIWVDSWHMNSQFMVCHRENRPSAIVSARASYPAPPGPDWGWRITVKSPQQNQLTIIMDNITPEGEEMMAVEIQYERVG